MKKGLILIICVLIVSVAYAAGISNENDRRSVMRLWHIPTDAAIGEGERRAMMGLMTISDGSTSTGPRDRGRYSGSGRGRR